MFLHRRRRRATRLEALENTVKRQGEQLAFTTAALRCQGASSGPAVPPELAEAAAMTGERAVIVDVGGEEVILVLGDGKGDPQALWDAVLAEITPGSQRGIAS